LLVEGASDVAAAMLLGISVIGRPSNLGGRALLGELLATFPESRDILVLGERDQKDSGLWPGRNGAIQTATDLAKRLQRPIQWALPPDNSKDLRAWLIEYARRTPGSMANTFLAGLQPATVHPPPIQRAPRQQTEAEISIDDYRHEMLRLRRLSLDRPGVYLDRSGTGHGKSSVEFQFLCAELLGEVRT
jgi:hypothetical protein